MLAERQNPFAMKPQKPQKPLRALHGAQIREAQNMKQFMFCVPTHPASVPDASSVPINVEVNKQKYHPTGGWYFCLLVEPAGIEPASASPLQADLHT